MAPIHPHLVILSGPSIYYFYHGEQHQYQTPKGDPIKENMLASELHHNQHNHDKYQ
jgi:hypothetical protein